MQKHYRLLGILFLFLQTPLASSQSGGVAWFDAPSESYVDIGSTNNSNCFSDLQNGDVLTVTMWVKWDDKSASNVGNWANCLTYADSVGNADNGTFWCQHNNQNSRFEFQLQTGNGQPQSILSSTDPQEGNWYHVAHVYDGTFMMIYVNGNLENYAFESGNLNVSSNSKLNMGRMPNSSNNHRYFDGAMDEVSVWKRALTQQEIQTLMNNPESLLGLNYDANGLIGYWDFNDFEVDDKSPCDNDGGGSSSFTTVPMGAEVTRTTASGDCNDPGNWNNGVPDDSTTAIVEDSVYMTQRTTTKHLVLKDSLNSMGDTLTIEGDMIQKGNFIPSGGVLEFDCSSTSTRKIVAKQPFKANEMLVDVPSKVELDTGSLHIRETLKMVSGTLDVGKKELTLLSDSNGTARIAALPSNAAIQGQIAVQRWIPSGNAGWIDMAAPNRDSVIVDEWDDDIYISGKTTGGFDDGCSWSSGCFWSVKRSNSNGELVDVTSAFTSLENGRGYELFIGDDGGVNVMNSDTTVTVKGRIKQSNSFSVNVNDNQWSLVANPFASPIDFDAIGLNNVDPYYYVAAATGSYEWYDRSSNSSSHPEVGPIITSSQGFWVKGNGSNASITFQQSHKTGAAASFAKDNGAEAFELTLTDASNGLSSSIMLHEGDPNAFSEVAHKATPVIGAPDLYTFGTNRNEVRAIALENDGSKAEIPLRVTPENQGVFRFKAKGLDQLPYSHAVLEDRSTGKEYELHGKEMVQVRLSPSDSGNERFFLRLTDKDPTGIEKEPDEGEASIIIRTEGRALFFKKKGKPKVYRTSLHDATGQEVRSPEEVRLDASGVRWMNELSKGIYFVRLQGPQKSISKKVFIGGNR